MEIDPLVSLEDWQAVAREHGGVAAYLERPELPDLAGHAALEPLILTIRREPVGLPVRGLISVHLRQVAGMERLAFLADETDLQVASRTDRW